MPNPVSDEEFAARATALARKLEAAILNPKGYELTEERFRKSRGWRTVSIVEGFIEGKLQRLITVNNTTYYKLLSDRSGEFLIPGETLGKERPINVYGVNPEGKKYRFMTHAEQIGSNEFMSRGGQAGRVATSNPACDELCLALLKEQFPTLRYVRYVDQATPEAPKKPSGLKKEGGQPRSIPADAAERGTVASDRATANNRLATEAPHRLARNATTDEAGMGTAGSSDATARDLNNTTAISGNAKRVTEGIKEVNFKFNRNNIRIKGRLLASAQAIIITVAIMFLSIWLERKLSEVALEKSLKEVGKKALQELKQLTTEIETMINANPFRQIYVHVHARFREIQDSPLGTPLQDMQWTSALATFDKLVLEDEPKDWLGKQAWEYEGPFLNKVTPFIYSFSIDMPDRARAFIQDLDFLIETYRPLFWGSKQPGRTHALSAMLALLTARQKLPSAPLLSLQALRKGRESLPRLLASLHPQTSSSAALQGIIQMWDEVTNTLTEFFPLRR